MQAGKDLAALLADIPDESLAMDWSYLCKQMAAGPRRSARRPRSRKLADTRRAGHQRRAARLVEVGSTANQAAIAGDVAALVKSLTRTKRRQLPVVGNVFRRPARRARCDGKGRRSSSGLSRRRRRAACSSTSRRARTTRDTSDDAMLDYLAVNLYTGHGAHSIFMKTWAAGLAYSNGLRPRISEARSTYYAERCPLLPQTLRFVIDQLRKAQARREHRALRDREGVRLAHRDGFEDARDARWPRTSSTA